MLYNKNANTWNTSIGDRLGLTSVAVDHIVNGMVGDRSGNIWVGTDRAGLVRFNVNTLEMENIQPTSLTGSNTSDEVIGVQSVYVDDTDLLWVGTEKSGVAYYGNSIYKFATNLLGDITAMAQTGDSERPDAYPERCRQNLLGCPRQFEDADRRPHQRTVCR